MKYLSNILNTNTFSHVVDRVALFKDSLQLAKIAKFTPLSIPKFKLKNRLSDYIDNAFFYDEVKTSRYINTSNNEYPIYNATKNTLDLLKFNPLTMTLEVVKTYTPTDFGLTNFVTTRNNFAIMGNKLFIVFFNRQKFVRIDLDTFEITDLTSNISNWGANNQLVVSAKNRLVIVKKVVDSGYPLTFSLVVYNTEDDSILNEFDKQSGIGNYNHTVAHNYGDYAYRNAVYHNFWYIHLHTYTRTQALFWLNIDTGALATPSNVEQESVQFQLESDEFNCTVLGATLVDSVVDIDISHELIATDSNAIIHKDYNISLLTNEVKFWSNRVKYIETEYTPHEM